MDILSSEFTSGESDQQQSPVENKQQCFWSAWAENYALEVLSSCETTKKF